MTPTILDRPRTRKAAPKRRLQPLPEAKVQGAFGRPGRLRHPVDYSPVTEPKFLSRAARERLHVSHS